MTPDIQKAILRACGRFIRKALEPIEKRIVDMETKAIEIPFDGVVKELLSADELKTLVDLHVSEAVTKYFEMNPIQKGDPGERGADGVNGEKGEPGADGEGLACFVINRDGTLIAATTKGNVVELGPVVGKDGAPGRDGKDGADFTDVEFEYDGERSLVIRGKGGELVKRLPIPIDRGYWREGTQAEKGDVLTHDGSAWIALKDTDTKPGHDEKDAWRMMARKGRDGAPGPAGKEYTPPVPVKLGTDHG